MYVELSDHELNLHWPAFWNRRLQFRCVKKLDCLGLTDESHVRRVFTSVCAQLAVLSRSTSDCRPFAASTSSATTGNCRPAKHDQLRTSIRRKLYFVRV